ncbi:MAG: phosphoglycerate kinase [Candidatus Parcubacteria bacterium]|nr:MAG: phosphoglycerate kinase [Candidatus Parcubacteria bacterium]
MKFISQIKKETIKGKTALLLLDLNIEKSEWKNSLRLERAIRAIDFLLKKEARVVVLSFKGRPDLKLVKNKDYRASFSLFSIAQEISKRLRTSFDFVDDFNFKNWKEKVKKSSRSLIFLENLRFFKEERENSLSFGKLLASLGDFYVNDAFSVCHRQQASITRIPKFVPAYGGMGMEIELNSLKRIFQNPLRPVTLIVGGAKVDDKMRVIENLYPKVDSILCGGGVANTLLFFQNLPVGSSLVEKDLSFRDFYFRFKEKIVLPVDFLWERGAIFDIGPKTIKKFSSIIDDSKTIIWSGPMGFFEKKNFAAGTKALVKKILKSKAFCVIGGEQTTSAFLKFSKTASKKISRNPFYFRKNIFLSSGGGAMLYYLSSEKLPGLVALENSSRR